MNAPFSSRVIALAVLGLVVSARAGTDGERPLSEAASENHRFVLRIDPGAPGQAGHSCMAALLARLETPSDAVSIPPDAAAALPPATQPPGGNAERTSTRARAGERRMWCRRLLNEVGPVRAFVRDDGEFVVTLDEAGRGGARHALVIYGPRGRAREFALPELLGKTDWAHVQVREHQVRWLDGAKFAFEDERDQFVVRLAWGRTLRINLKALTVLDEAGQRVRPDRLAVPATVLAELRRSAASVANTTAPAVAAAKVNETRMPAAHDSGNGHRAGAATSGKAGANPASGGEAWFNSDLDIPAPNCDQKTDYLAWINGLGVVDGPDAAPLYAEAADLFRHANDLDPNFDLAAAAAGQPELLMSAEFAAWRASHAGAVALFREAAQYPAKSWHFAHSESEMLYGILLPHLAQARGMARACVAEGRYQLLLGNPEEAAACYLDALAAGKHFGDEPVLISNLVGLAMQRAASEALLDLAADPAAADLDFAQLADEAEEWSQPVAPIGESVRLERAGFLDLAQRLWDRENGTSTFDSRMLAEFVGLINGDGANGSSWKTRLAGVGIILGGFDAMVSAGNAYFDRLEDAMALPYPEASQALATLDDWITRGQGVHPALQLLAPSPAMSNARLASARSEATRRAALVVAHLQADYQQTAAYPDSLGALGELATDPFTTLPFGYERVGDTFRLYSRGAGTRPPGSSSPTVLDAVVKGAIGTARDPSADEIVYWPRPVSGS